MKQCYYQKKIETMSVEKIKKIQSKKLISQVKRVYDNIPYYRELMDKVGVKPSDIRGINDLKKLPFLTKQDLNNTYPYGFLATSVSNCVCVHSTSGTTGRRIINFYTKNDVDLLEDCCARAIVAAGGNSNDVCQVAYGYGLFTGGLGLHGGSNKVGCLTLPMSTSNTERQIQFMNDIKSTILCCTPSYASYIGEKLKEKGYKSNDLSLRIGIFGAEPWTENMRRDLEKNLGIKAYDIYGLTEMIGPGVAFECSEQNGMHVNEDHFIVEIIDPNTGEVLPDGVEGELVFTSLDNEAFPLLRYRTHDICKIYHNKCSCGRNFVKMCKPVGRTDEMLIIRGINVFPSQIEIVLMNEGYSSNYQIIVDRVNNIDVFEIKVEISDGKINSSDDEINVMKKDLTNAMKNMLGINPKISFVEPMGISRSEGKAVRVIDKRKL